MVAPSPRYCVRMLYATESGSLPLGRGGKGGHSYLTCPRVTTPPVGAYHTPVIPRWGVAVSLAGPLEGADPSWVWAVVPPDEICVAGAQVMLLLLVQVRWVARPTANALPKEAVVGVFVCVCVGGGG